MRKRDQRYFQVQRLNQTSSIRNLPLRPDQGRLEHIIILHRIFQLAIRTHARFVPAVDSELHLVFSLSFLGSRAHVDDLFLKALKGVAVGEAASNDLRSVLLGVITVPVLEYLWRRTCRRGGCERGECRGSGERFGSERVVVELVEVASKENFSLVQMPLRQAMNSRELRQRSEWSSHHWPMEWNCSRC